MGIQHRAVALLGPLSGLVFMAILVAVAMGHAWASPPEADATSRFQIRLKTETVDAKNEPARPGAQFLAEGLDPAELSRVEQARPTSARWASIFAVYIKPESGRVAIDQPPLAGSYSVKSGILAFHPRYPLEPGTSYQAVLNAEPLLESNGSDGSAGAANPARAERLNPKKAQAGLVVEFTVDPKRGEAQEPPQVVAVEPSLRRLPENLLKFYIRFSNPMSRGVAYRNLALLDAAGKPIADPFLELDEELWSPDGRRFTLLFDPGRIKRGLKPREEVGPILEEGKTYTLVINAGWPDAVGQALPRETRLTFRAGPADETSPNPSVWRLQPPQAGTREPLRVDFEEPMDAALAERLIVVRDADGRVVGGRPELSREATAWTLSPTTPWRTGYYQLEVGVELEDLAGNSVERPFEVDLVDEITDRLKPRFVSLPFRIGPTPARIGIGAGRGVSIEGSGPAGEQGESRPGGG
jgi:hypothetical protein